MAKRQVLLTFVPDPAKGYIEHNENKIPNIVISVQCAGKCENYGWIILELEGDREDLEQHTARAIITGFSSNLITRDIV